MIKFYDITKNDNKYSKKIFETIKYNIRNNDFVNGNSKKLFETNFAKYIGVKHCIGVANGTDALEIALRALNLPKNSEVLLQWNTYISTAFSISNNDLKPIFVDINIETHKQYELLYCFYFQFITNWNRQTKALIASA